LRKEKDRVKLKLSISQRLVIWITFLVFVLFGAVLFIIQRREVQTLSEQASSRAVLIAKYMAEINLQPLVRYDTDTIQANINKQVDNQLPYIIFYNRSGSPIVFNELVRTQAEVLGTSHFDEDVQPGAQFMETRRVLLQDQWLRVREVEIPIFLPGNDTKWASVKIGQSLEPMHAAIREVRLVLILVGFGGVFLGILGASVLARRLTRPLRKLVDGTVRVSKGDFSRAIDVASGDEIGELARGFNEMTGRLLETRDQMDAANRKLVQAEKLASIGRLAATIAHEIRNPLTSVKLNLQKVAESERLDDVEREHIGLSMEGAGQIEKFIKELLNFTRVADLSLVRFPVEQVLEESIKLLRESLTRKAITVEKKYAPGLPQVLVDGDKMRQVFLNVLRNAEEALEPGGRITVTLDLAGDAGHKKIRVRISDDGPGIPEKNRDVIFEPFFTTKPSGFGLGLANARKIVEQHNGSIRLARPRGRGTSFVILIPCEEGS
jgi:signal transduction histidine kinase